MSTTRHATCGLYAASAAVAAGWVLAPVAAQDPGQVTIEVGECVQLQSPEARLACFEREVEAAKGGAQPSAPAAPRTPEPVRPEPPTARAAEPPSTPRPAEPAPPTVTERRAARADEKEQEEAARAARAIVAKVTALRETVPNVYLITLDNGQVWRQTRPEWYPLRPGHEVQLSATRWGTAFRLTAPEIHGSIQVERIR